jgi:hypothetical protein
MVNQRVWETHRKTTVVVDEEPRRLLARASGGSSSGEANPGDGLPVVYLELAAVNAPAWFSL